MASTDEIIALYDHLLLHNANESDTRLKVINHVLYDILGWTHADVTTEEHVSEDGGTTWADYVLTTGMTAIVVEAKKVGVAFVQVPEKRRARLHGKFVTGDTGAAITQARDYARKLGLPFAVVTNGNSWIIFPATRVDQVSFKDSSAIIFPTLRSALRDDYAEFYDLLSREAVISGNLEAELLGRIENQIEDRRLNRFFTSNFSKISRHSLFYLIEDAITTSFTEDIVNSSPELLEKCYVRTPERIKFDSRINMHIAKRESVTARASARPMKGGRDSNISILIEDAAKRTRPVAVLVLGQVGAGKTTFLEHTREIGAKKLLEPDPGKAYPHWIKIDFKPFPRGESPIRYILSAVRDFINSDPFLSDYERCLKHAYKSEIDALFKGPLFLLAGDDAERRKRVSELLFSDYEAVQPYVEKIIAYAAARSAVFLVIDNIDQVEDEDTQTAIFSDAMAFAQKTRVNLICAMREATYVRNRNKPIFDAFDFDPVTIDPPDIKAVLSKRFFVARQMLEGRPASFTAENGAPVTVASLATVIDLVQSSVLGTELGNLIEVLATSDIRLALRMTREFLRSGWTASGKALLQYQSTGRYVMPQHEALRAIMLGNQQTYTEEFSVIANPFDSRLAKTEAQLLRLYLLNALVNLSSDKSFRYLEGGEIQKNFRAIGFGDKITEKVISDLCSSRFIHTTSHTNPTFDSNFTVSRLGGYITRHFISDMTFLENVMVDTFIADNDAWHAIKSITTEIYAERNVLRRMAARKRRVVIFFDYIKNMYNPLRDESVRRGLPKEWCGHPLEAIEKGFETNLQRAMRSAESNYGNASRPVRPARNHSHTEISNRDSDPVEAYPAPAMRPLK